MMLECRKCLLIVGGNRVGVKCPTYGCPGFLHAPRTLEDVTVSVPGAMTCPRREDIVEGTGKKAHPDHAGITGKDRWLRYRESGDRVCSFCGSLHPDDFFALVEASSLMDEMTDPEDVVLVQQTSRRYKVVVTRPDVRSPAEGGTRFYLQHVPVRADGRMDVTREQDAKFRKACKASQDAVARGNAPWASGRPGTAGRG